MLTRDDILNSLGELDRQQRSIEDDLRRIDGAQRLARLQLGLIDQREAAQKTQDADKTETPTAAAA